MWFIQSEFIYTVCFGSIQYVFIVYTAVCIALQSLILLSFLHLSFLSMYLSVFHFQVYSSMERLSLHEEKRTPPPTKRSLSEEGGERIDSLSGLKSRDRSWLVGSPEM